MSDDEILEKLEALGLPNTMANKQKLKSIKRDIAKGGVDREAALNRAQEMIGAYSSEPPPSSPPGGGGIVPEPPTEDEIEDQIDEDNTITPYDDENKDEKTEEPEKTTETDKDKDEDKTTETDKDKDEESKTTEDNESDKDKADKDKTEEPKKTTEPEKPASTPPAAPSTSGSEPSTNGSDADAGSESESEPESSGDGVSRNRDADGELSDAEPYDVKDKNGNTSLSVFAPGDDGTWNGKDRPTTVINNSSTFVPPPPSPPGGYVPEPPTDEEIEEDEGSIEPDEPIEPPNGEPTVEPETPNESEPIEPEEPSNGEGSVEPEESVNESEPEVQTVESEPVNGGESVEPIPSGDSSGGVNSSEPAEYQEREAIGPAGSSGGGAAALAAASVPPSEEPPAPAPEPVAPVTEGEGEAPIAQAPGGETEECQTKKSAQQIIDEIKAGVVDQAGLDAILQKYLSEQSEAPEQPVTPETEPQTTAVEEPVQTDEPKVTDRFEYKGWKFIRRHDTKEEMWWAHNPNDNHDFSMRGGNETGGWWSTAPHQAKAEKIFNLFRSGDIEGAKAFIDNPTSDKRLKRSIKRLEEDAEISGLLASRFNRG
jgi:hypothetical protein